MPLFARIEDARRGASPGVRRLLVLPSVAAAAVAAACLYVEHALVVPRELEAWLGLGESVAVVVFLARVALLLAFARDRDDVRAQRATAPLALLVLAGIGLERAQAEVPYLAEAMAGLTTLVLALLVLDGLGRLARLLSARLRLSAPVLIAVTFLIVIGAGAALLLSPRAIVPGRPALSKADAVFTATSAACVTGLQVRDLGADFTPFGQAVVLGLIQVGGLGLVTLLAIFTLASGGALAVRERLVLRDALSAEDLGLLGRALGFVVLTTVLIEGAGAVALAFLMDPAPAANAGWLARPWNGVFHSVSAFCNAGFTLDSRNLVPYQRDAAVLGVIMALIVAGGVGFGVVADLFQRVSPRSRERSLWPTGGQRRLGPTARLALVATGLLLIGGFAGTAALEWNGRAFEGLSPEDKLSNALFQSVTSRTAGFNAADMERLHPGTLFLTIGLMFVGGSPGSTAGGIKTTTFALLFLAVLAVWRGREDIEVSGRRIPDRIVRHAMVVVLVQATLVVAITFVLLVTEPGRPFLSLLFESVSATGTVGLSVNLTPGLGDAGKIALAIGMLCGRLGPLTVLLALAARAGRSADYRYPPADVMLG